MVQRRIKVVDRKSFKEKRSLEINTFNCSGLGEERAFTTIFGIVKVRSQKISGYYIEQSVESTKLSHRTHIES